MLSRVQSPESTVRPEGVAGGTHGVGCRDVIAAFRLRVAGGAAAEDPGRLAVLELVGLVPAQRGEDRLREEVVQRDIAAVNAHQSTERSHAA